MATFEAGQAVTWRHVPRGGYGYVMRVPATVVKQTPKRVQILAELKVGGYKLISVKPHSLE
jgi:hypothetical protein